MNTFSRWCYSKYLRKHSTNVVCYILMMLMAAYATEQKTRQKYNFNYDCKLMVGDDSEAYLVDDKDASWLEGQFATCVERRRSFQWRYQRLVYWHCVVPKIIPSFPSAIGSSSSSSECLLAKYIFMYGYCFLFCIEISQFKKYFWSGAFISCL